MCDSQKTIVELDPSGNDIYAFASRRALKVFAELIKVETPKMAEQVISLVDSEERKNNLALQEALNISKIDKDSSVSGHCGCSCHSGYCHDITEEEYWSEDDCEEYDDEDEDEYEDEDEDETSIETLSIEITKDDFIALSQLAHFCEVPLNDMVIDIIREAI